MARKRPRVWRIRSPRNSHLFLFLNRRGHLAQPLFWDRNGFVTLSTARSLQRRRLGRHVWASRNTPILTLRDAQGAAHMAAGSHRFAMQTLLAQSAELMHPMPVMQS
ncbi:MAG: IS66 family insertion sequence element accessory protein TnpB [Myxococcales bacterium]